ncbi:hypothetical protein QSE00_12650 [Arenibacter sp. M-2]|uniref:hypothetical protein n=1 Tax=unclassified Arenibacter TaxID=2615047 RepID=UPI000D76D713|nr:MULTISPECIES: hypothetical protein [unclassified Arenibacter]MDL5512671.1 hypothetical protein [Arenibacter sp. M-2]PXX28338.1 hypothetical protein C7972_105193 [Arenibacter sp. ARW7G5Y1]|tara:strand:+ start:40543 stop:41343 length:801 start_codon:yes stop_codon:yes gene_type:complete
MKTTSLLLTLCWFVLPATLSAQIGGSVFEITKKAQQEAKGEADDAAEKAKEEHAMENITKGLEAFGQSLSESSEMPMEIRCINLMGDHALNMYLVQHKIESANSCKAKKQLLEMQALQVLSAGTRIYCPEELYSDVVYYGTSILELYFSLKSQNYIPGTRELEDSLDNIKEASLVFGNPYSLNLNTLLTLDKDYKSYDKEGLLDLDALLLDLLDYESIPESDVEWQNKKKDFFTELMNYITYFDSPIFMLKRSNQINFTIENLPCK